MFGNDEQTRCVSHLLTVVTTVLSLISVALAYDDNSWNEIHKFTNITQSEFDRSDMMNNQKIGLFVFTQYCGPGERVWRSSGQERKPSSNMYADIDVCCKQHDGCPNYVSSSSDYDRYVGLPQKSQLFSRLECACDAQFFSCLNTLNSQYASTVAFGYGVVQSQCFDFNYPIVGCNKYSNSLLPPRRCIEYKVDDTKDKIWQWFDVPPASSKLYDFPRTTTN
ncbi:Phospholipase A2 [Pseudolycoriella hygida]|uniref:phospholipase A2 n=1 Tax=Pseudolycoriella hygida TaxID=35572 RepID=A0A9Q0RVR0_9DIPT|nr:Phospholipase A2 [Pseudolycoriella hygida]